MTAVPSPTHLTSVDGEGTFVIVSTVDIPAGTRLDPLISQGKFVTVEIPPQAVVPDAVIDINQLQGRSTTDRIYQNEQIPLARLGAIP